MNSTTNPGSSSVRPGESAACPVSVVIVTWNVAELLRDCLQSLRDDGIPDWAEIIVVDNASGDHTLEIVRNEYPWARLISSGTNLGYSRGNNLGIREASGETIFLLNPDTILHPGALRRLVDYMAAHPSVGIAGPKHVTGSGEIDYGCATDFPTAWNVFCDLSFLSRAFPQSALFNGRLIGHWDHLNDCEAPAIPGTAMLIRREVVKSIGVLDETMFYAEDMDYCARAREAGWGVFYLASASIVHLGGQSSKKTGNPGLQRQIAFQSFWLFTRKHRGPAAALRVTLMVLFWSLCAIPAASCIAAGWSASTPVGQKIREWRLLACRLLAWSITRKKAFRHHLAAAPQF
jgi:N-acetylglucosaminyl-diphospho-decaprenol L-rhamnosyltransferase